ncbi:MAG TPA: hypothetical protein VFE60_07000 [Roseiarcus sp.]|jgi:hypothetical protein|nr:hypothetical protein [Roseiarcus sp.]
MSDDPDYDPNLDWHPPKPVYGDDVLVDDIGADGLGRNQPFWKVLLWHTAKARTEMLRADSAAVGARALGEPDKPPRLAADEEPPAIDPDVLELIESKIDELAARMDGLERRKAAEEALLALEDEIERMYPASDDNDDDDMALNPRRH